MRPVELELLVQAAVEARRAGRNVEDDRIEFKSDWPAVAKARQLAGAANALRGEPLVYIIGIRDNGDVVAHADLEPSDWYTSIASAFDSEPPSLLLHRRVQVSDEPADAVTALAFSTDLYPYVMPVAGASDRREVPVRVASGTSSANRYQLMRLLQPTVLVPAFTFTEARMSATWKDTPRPVKGGGPEDVQRHLELDCTLSASIFIENVSPHVVTLPVREMSARLRFGEHEFRPSVHGGGRGWGIRETAPPKPQHGVYFEDNHVISTAPGEFTVYASPRFDKAVAPSDELSSLYDVFKAVDLMTFDLALRVAGVDRLVMMSTELHRTEPPTVARERTGLKGWIEEPLGGWRMRVERDDPWATESD